MEDLLQKQIHNSCKLALPEGLKELMSDISREVLRAQPNKIYDFIANYLSVLLISREHLAIAGHLCNTICTTSSCQELEDELRYLKLEEEKAGRVKEVILEYFNGGNMCKNNLTSKLLNELDLSKEQIEVIKLAVQKAFKRSLINNTVYYESSSDSDQDEIDLATKNTLKIYRKTNVSSETYKRATDNVKASYRAYGVTRYDNAEEAPSEPHINKPSIRNIRFEANNENTDSEDKKKLSTVSSITLAGSFINLPKHVPYSVHDNSLQIVEESTEREDVSIDYIDEYEEKNTESNDGYMEYKAANTEINDEYKTEQDFAIDDEQDIDDDQEIADIDSESSINEELMCEYSDDVNKEF